MLEHTRRMAVVEANIRMDHAERLWKLDKEYSRILSAQRKWQDILNLLSPSATYIRLMARLGNKSEARNTMQAAGVPVIPGTKEPVFDWETGLSEADRIGFPVMIKAALGGGGKGMRMAETRGEFQSAFQTAQKEAKSSFADGTMYVERLIRHPRHVEFQIMADSFGNVIHLGERDCSSQRNH